MQLEWARAVHNWTAKPVIILAPLAVAAQTVHEGARLGVDVRECRQQSDCHEGINVTNYERLHKFDPSWFGAVVLDESGCIKHQNSKTFSTLTDSFRETPWKLCATATPAPNDYTELGTHAEFLGICTRAEMLAEYFVHDGGETQTWRLKGHAKDVYWRWVAGWGAMVKRPSDLGYDDGGYALPPFRTYEHVVPISQDDVLATGRLFASEARTLLDRRGARRDSVRGRVAKVAEIVNDTDRPWVVWCDLNAESAALTEAIDGAIEVTGAMDIDEKERRLRAFAAGDARVIVTKPSIAGFGLNWQHCADMAFCGVTDSWEAYYQAVRRCWRFGQKRVVNVHVVTAETEGAVVANLSRKDAAAEVMGVELSAATRDAVRLEVTGQARQTNAYAPTKKMEIPQWLLS
jgi:hypothetical protein